MLKLTLQYFGHLMRRANSLEKTLMLGKTESKWRRGRPRMRWLDSITDSMDTNLSKLWETVQDNWAWRAEVHGVKESGITKQQQNATELSYPNKQLKDCHPPSFSSHQGIYWCSTNKCQQWIYPKLFHCKLIQYPLLKIHAHIHSLSPSHTHFIFLDHGYTCSALSPFSTPRYE